jgi:hypothetical protein
MSSSIRYIDDQDGNHVFPVTHERAVRDSDGVTLETKLGQKQATLISGTNIKTVNGTSLLGEGDITVQTQMTLDDIPTSGSENAVKSGGVYSAVAGKQETISTVNVTLENNSGAPSGSASVNGGTVNFTFSNINGTDGVDGVGFDSISSPQDGTATITLTNGDTVTLDLNHNHPQYLKYVLLADEAAYAALATKDSDTLYLIPEE